MVALRRRVSRAEFWRRVVARSVRRRRTWGSLGLVLSSVAEGGADGSGSVEEGAAAVLVVVFVVACHWAFSASRAAILLLRSEPACA